MKWKQRELEFREYVYDGVKIQVQYIGRKDTNEKKIFEADICRIELYEGVLMPVEWVTVVKYNITNCSFQYKGENEFICPIDRAPNIEIIGNAFHNPELVKKYNLEE